MNLPLQLAFPLGESCPSCAETPGRPYSPTPCRDPASSSRQSPLTASSSVREELLLPAPSAFTRQGPPASMIRIGDSGTSKPRAVLTQLLKCRFRFGYQCLARYRSLVNAQQTLAGTVTGSPRNMQVPITDSLLWWGKHILRCQIKLG